LVYLSSRDNDLLGRSNELVLLLSCLIIELVL